MNAPQVSVVITFYREGVLLSETIESVLKQTFQDFEIILVDNNADSVTRNQAKYYVSQYPDRIILIQETQQGVTHARNSGIKESRSPFIAFLDGDDLMMPDKLMRQYSFLKQQSDLVLVVSNYDILSHDSIEVLQKNVTGPAYGINSLERLREDYLTLFRNSFSPLYIDSFELLFPSTWLVRKDALLKSGLFNTTLTSGGWEDYELLMRLFKQGGFFRIPESLCFYRAESPETRAQKNKNYTQKKRFLSVEKYVDAIWESYGSTPKNIPVIQHIRSVWLQVFGVALMSYTEGKKLGMILLARAVMASPQDTNAWKLLVKSFMPRFKHPKLFWFQSFNNDSLKEIDISFIKSFLKIPSFAHELHLPVQRRRKPGSRQSHP